MFKLLEEQTGEAWEPTNSMLSRESGTLKRKLRSFTLSRAEVKCLLRLGTLGHDIV